VPDFVLTAEQTHDKFSRTIPPAISTPSGSVIEVFTREAGGGHLNIDSAVSIRERPAEAEDRAVPGHWEGGFFFGNNNSQIATPVQRQTRYVMPVRVPSKDTETVIKALIKQAHKLPREFCELLT